MKINSFIQYAPITKPADAPAAASANKNQLKPIPSLPEFDKQPGLPSRLQPKEEKTFTTMAVGEEGSSLPEADKSGERRYTTMAVGEEGSTLTIPESLKESLKDTKLTSMAVGEEGSSFTVPESTKDIKFTTMAVGEEGGHLAEAIENFKERHATTLAIGEEGGVNIGDLIRK